MKKTNVIALGCFYQVDVDLPGRSEETKTEAYELVLIGCIFSKIEPENGRNETLLNHIDQPRWNA